LDSLGAIEFVSLGYSTWLYGRLLYVKPNKLVVVASVWELQTLLVTGKKLVRLIEIHHFLGWLVLVCDELIALGVQNRTLRKDGLNFVWLSTTLSIPNY